MLMNAAAGDLALVGILTPHTRYSSHAPRYRSVTRTVKSCAVITVLGSPIASTVDYSSLPVKSHREELVHTRDTPNGTEMGAYSQYGGIRSI